MSETPLVSICCISYNHARFIKQCLEGFAIQKTDFSYEILIFDDASQDNTQTIIKDFAKQHDHIAMFLQSENQWSKKKYGLIDWLFPAAKGKYIALCEGDDYWTDALKLQKQVGFLEANPDYNICFHEVGIFNQSKNEIESNNITRNVLETTDINDLAKGNYIHTPSVVMRNNFTLPKWFNKTSIGDWSLYMIVVNDKKIKKLDEVMAVYRVHNDSIWSQKTNEFRIVNTIKSYKLILSSINLKTKTKKILQTSIEDLENHLPKKPTFIEKIFNKIKKRI